MIFKDIRMGEIKEKTQMEKWLNIKTGEMQRNQPKMLMKRGHRGRRNRRVMI